MFFDDSLGYDYYRQSYLVALANKVFPWEAAYYYYLQHIDRIDIMGFDEFKNTLIKENTFYDSPDEAYAAITKPIYESLDNYYSPVELLTADNKLIALV